MGLFSCCFNDKESRNDSDARHARIVGIYAQAAHDAQPLPRVPPPAYNEIVGENELPATVAVLEKQTQHVPDYERPQIVSPGSSPRTSICSVPSTRLTDITAVPTGATSVTAGRHRTGDSLRSSLVFDSAPPSYYDGRSIRERSQSPHSQRVSRDRQRQQQHHDITTDDWLEVLRRTVEVADAHIRQLERS